MALLPWLRSPEPDPEEDAVPDDAEETAPPTATTDDPPERWDVDGPTVIDVATARRLDVALVAGEVDVLGRDEPGARVEVRSVSRAGLTVLAADGGLRISQRGEVGAHAASARIAISVQHDAVLDLRVVSAEVLISDLRRGLAVETASGGVVLDGTAGEARVRSVSGEVALRDHTGAVDLRTVSGEVTASGAISRFRSRAVSGEVFLDAVDPDEVRADSVSGDVTVRLGASRPAAYEIRTFSGRVQLDGRDVGRAVDAHRSRWGDPDGPAVPVRISSASGSVRVVHAETE